MKKFLFTALITVLCVPSSLASNAIVLSENNIISLDTTNNRYVGGCWENKNNEVFYYKDENDAVEFIEICNEPDAGTFGKGETSDERVENYYQFLQTKREEELKKFPNQDHIKIVIGSLSGYNQEWFTKFLDKENACELFDVMSFHPYHFGVAPDEINTEKNAWHTVEQWTHFYQKQIEEKCGKNGKKPIWATEFGYTTKGFDAEQKVTESQQLDFAIKQVLLLLGSGSSRIQYFDGASFSFSEKNREKYQTFLDTIDGATFIEMKYFDENYCPKGKGTSCFYTNPERTEYGFSVDSKEVKKGRSYVFEKDGELVKISWILGGEEYKVEKYHKSLFSDISGSHKYFASTEFIKTKNLVKGYADGTYRPENSITRAEFTKIVLLAKHSQEEIDSVETRCTVSLHEICSFSDVSADDWYENYVQFAKEKNIISGFPHPIAGTSTPLSARVIFKPNQEITFAESSKVIVNVLISSSSLDSDREQLENSAEWWTPFVEKLEESSVGNANLRSLQPEKNITRGEMAELIYGLREFVR